MSYAPLSFILMFCMDFIMYYYMTRLLDMRSNALFYGIEAALFLLDFASRENEVLFALHAVMFFICYFFVPLLCSRGPLLHRAARLLLLFSFTMVSTELLGSIVYALLTNGQAHPQVIDASNVAPYTVTYLFIASCAVMMLEFLARLVNRRGIGGFSHATAPVIAFMAIPFVMHSVIYIWLFVPHINADISLVYLLAADTLLCIVLTLTLLRVCEQDGAARRKVAQHHAAKLQLAALKRQLTSSVSRAGSLRRLRHDLANQVDVVGELVQTGHTAEALSHLVQLQAQAEEAGVRAGIGAKGPSTEGGTS